jgi:type IV secretory pathway TraG/TraD family ATPase VirD4
MVVVPNLLDYPGSAFVLDLKGETYTVTAVRRAMGQTVAWSIRSASQVSIGDF